jgi:tetratricopeptide (TPR) repeat protein
VVAWTILMSAGSGWSMTQAGQQPGESNGRPSPPGAVTEPTTAAGFLARASSRFERKEYNAAIADYSEAIRLEPGSAAAYALRAAAWGVKHARDREVADLGQAIRLDPTNADYRVARARSWSAQGRHEHAMDDYDAAIRLRPQDAALYVARGDEYRRHLKLDLALDDYNRAIQLAPDDARAYICRAMVAKQRRAFAQAVAELTDLTQMAPGNPEVHRVLARILATCYKDEVRDGSRAVQEATRACELTRWRDPDCLDTLAAAFAETGDYDSAVAWQKQAIALARREATSPMQRALNFGGRRGVGFEDRLAFYKRKQPARE